MKVCIIGSKGYIGENLSRYLTGQGWEVYGISSSGNGIDPLTGLFRENYTLPSSTDAVVFLAQSPLNHRHPTSINHLLNVNVISAVKAAECARKSGVKRFLYASTGNVYSPSFAPLREDSPLRRDNWYSLSKIHAEESLALFQGVLKITAMRLFGVYGPGQKGKLISKLLQSLSLGEEVYIEKKSGDPKDIDGLRISLCYIEDLLRILTQLLLQDGPMILNVAGERDVSIREIALLLASLIGKKASFRILNQERQGDLVADISLLRKIIPSSFTHLHQGLVETVNFEMQKNLFIAQ